MAVRVAVVPSPHDPDSYIKTFGAAAFKQLITQAQGFFDYYLGRLCATQELTSDKGRLAVLRAMADAVNKTGNVVLIDKYAQKTALRLGVTPEAVRTEFKKAPRPKMPVTESTEEPAETVAQIPPPSNHEYWLVKLLLMNEDLVDWAANYLEVNWVQHPVVKQVVDWRLKTHVDQSWTSLAAFLGQCEAPELQNLITEATMQERALPNPAQQLADVTLRLRNEFIDRQMAGLKHRVNQPETDETERLDLLRHQQALRQQKLQPLASVRPL
jgi:DNA primase